MKKYLEEFFAEFEYGDKEARLLSDAYDKIAENGETNRLLNEALGIYEESISCDYKKIIALADEIAQKLYLKEYTVELLVFVCLSKRLREVYRERGVADEIYKETVLDLKYKMWECQEVKGVVGSFVAGWFTGFFAMTRFALGRLQFELDKFGTNYEEDGYRLTPESRVIQVHIPRSLKPLDAASCDAAFLLAKEFFKEEVGEVCPFVCHSWLLYPENKKILSPKSNTYKFMERFHITDFGTYKDNEDLWRLFDTDEQNVDRLPTDCRPTLQCGGRMPSI